MQSHDDVAKGKSKPNAVLALRDIPLSDRYFWKDTLNEQLTQQTTEMKPGRGKRVLPANEILALALNEIAAVRGRGFFYHLLTREAWTSWPGEELHPRSRVPSLPGSKIPPLLYMNYIWSETSRQAFFSEKHRGRYLKCDFMMNPPDAAVPLYAIQYTTSSNQFLYTTPIDSLILLSNKESIFLLKVSELEKVAGRWPARKRRPRGPDPEQRLNTVPYIWNPSNNPEKFEEIRRYSLTSAEDVYNKIFGQCNPFSLPSTFTSAELRQSLPRPITPELGIALGSSVREPVFRSADPPSRRGETYVGRQKKKLKR